MLLSVVLFLVSRLCILSTNPNIKPIDKARIKEKFLIDYVFYTSYVLLKPKVSNLRVLRSMWRNSKSGLLITLTLVWGGFLILEYYSTNFLSSLTLPFYEKPIEDIPGKQKRANAYGTFFDQLEVISKLSIQ